MYQRPVQDRFKDGKRPEKTSPLQSFAVSKFGRPVLVSVLPKMDKRLDRTGLPNITPNHNKSLF